MSKNILDYTNLPYEEVARTVGSIYGHNFSPTTIRHWSSLIEKGIITELCDELERAVLEANARIEEYTEVYKTVRAKVTNHPNYQKHINELRGSVFSYGTRPKYVKVYQGGAQGTGKRR